MAEFDSLVRYVPAFVYFSFSPTRISVKDFSASIGAWVFKLCIHLDVGQVNCVTENQIVDVYFDFFFKFSLFPSLTPMKCIWTSSIKDFSATT